MRSTNSYSTMSSGKIALKNLLPISGIFLSLLYRFSTLLACFCLSTVVFAKDKPFFYPPSLNSWALSFTSIDGNQLGFRWNAGNGTRRIVVMKQGAAITHFPQNGIDYTDSNLFGLGQEIGPIGSGEFVVADGTMNSINAVHNLNHSTTYSIVIFEYNGTGSSTEYLTPGYQTNGSTVAIPGTPASSVWANYITGNSLGLHWTKGNGARRLVVAREGSAVNADPVNYTNYYALSGFGDGYQIGTGNYAVFNDTGANAWLLKLKPSTTYHFTIFEYNGYNAPVYLIPGTTASFTTAPRPTGPSSNPLFREIEGNSFFVYWGSGNGSRRIVIAKLGSMPSAIPVDGQDYIANSTFGDANSEIAPGEYVVCNTEGNAFYLYNLVHSTTYYFKIYEYDGTGTQTAYLTTSYGSGNNSTATFPATPTGPISFSNIGGNSMTINWTNGSGERRLVLVRQGSAVTVSPTNYSKYSANPAFGSGAQVGTGNYVVYGGSGSSVNITNLAPLTTYHVSIFEYNGNNGPVYITTASTAQQITVTEPTVAPQSIVFSQVQGCSERVGWTSGNGQLRMVIAKQGAAVTASPVDGQVYTANTSFGSGQQISANEYIVYDGIGNFVDITGFSPNTTYYFKIVEYNNSAGITDYMSTGLTGNSITLSYPTSQVTSVNSTMIEGSKARLTWTNGTGGNSRLVLMKQGSAVDSDPSDCVAPYLVSPSFGSGTELGTGNYVVFFGDNTQVDVSHLLPNTTYHVSVYEANGSPPNLFLRSGATYSFTTAPNPTINASNFAQTSSDGNQLSIMWTSGNGQRRLVVGKQGSAVTGVPVNGIDYNGSQTFGSGDVIAPGEFVLYNGELANIIAVSNLSPATKYYFKIFENDGTGSNTVYLIPGALTGSASTDSTPSLQASGVSFTNVGTHSLRLNWTNGTGEGRFIIARANDPVSATPVDLTRYNDHQNFGSGFHFGDGNYAIAYSSTSSNDVYGLLSGTTYHFAIFEHNGYYGALYLRPGTTGFVTTPGPPQTQATNVSAGSVTGQGMTIAWTNGSGNRRLVLMKAGSAVDAVPVNNTNYTASNFFGSGSQLGSANYVVHNSTAANVTVSGLSPNITYHFAVYEYNFFSASSSEFLISNPPRGNATTASTVPVTLRNLKATVKNGKVDISWTTMQESNSSYFEILRSRNENQFEKIGALNAAGNSDIPIDYSFVDANVTSGQYFYRLNQVDKDQKSKLSQVLRVDLQKKFTISIAPNPVQSEMRIDGADEIIEIELLDLTGKIIRRYQRSSDNKYSVHGISGGSYFVRLIGNNETEVLKILIQ